MEIHDIELGMELKSREKKNLFGCENIDTENKTVEGRMIRKGGELGKRVIKDTSENIIFV